MYLLVRNEWFFRYLCYKKPIPMLQILRKGVLIVVILHGYHV